MAKLREARLTDDEIRRALEATLTRPECDLDYSVSYGQSGIEARDDRWLRNATRLVEAGPGGGR